MIRSYDVDKIVQFLIEEDELANLNMLGAIRNIKGDIFNNPKDQVEIYVDDLNHPNGVVVREHEYWHYVYAKNDAFVLQAKEELFDHYTEYGINASDESVFKLLTKDRILDWEEPCVLFYVDKHDLVPHTATLKLDDGTVKDADLINEHYTFKDEFSLKFIEECLENRPSSVYRVDGEAVGWVLIHRDNSIGIMYIKEAYRKKGIAHELSMDIINKVIEEDQIPFVHINVENTASMKLAKKCGYKRVKDIYWFGIKK